MIGLFFWGGCSSQIVIKPKMVKMNTRTWNGLLNNTKTPPIASKTAMNRIQRRSRNEPPKVSGAVELIESDRLSMERIRSAYRLTAREAQIALEIAYGKTDHQIAATMGVAFSTIRTHINHLYEKLGVRNRAALVRLICA